MSRHRVSISGKVEPTGEPRDKARKISSKVIEAGNVADAITTAVRDSGLDGFASGEFSIKVSDPDE
jgi:hypothetical protein